MLDLTETPEGLACLGTRPAFDPEACDLVFCQECSTWHQPAEDWRCPKCNRLAAFATQPHTCEECGKRGLAVRCGHQVGSLCLCQETPEARRLRLKQEAEAEHRRAVERQMAELARQRLAKERALKGEAAACWTGRGHRCNEKADLYACCRACVRWRNQEEERKAK